MENSYKTFLAGGGEMGELIRGFNWSATSLGAPHSWSPGLLLTVSILLNSRFAMILFWGDDCIQFYNDAYRASLGNNGKHPSALGSKGENTWAERWPVISARIQHIKATGQPTWSEDETVMLNRNNRLETTYWTYSYSQVKDDSGAAAGVLVVCHESTQVIEKTKQIQHLNEELSAANEELALSNKELAAANGELAEAQNNLRSMIVQVAENESKFRTLVEQIPVAINVFETRDLIVSLPNDKMLEIWGRTAEEMNGKPLLEAMPELQGQPFMKRLQDVLTTGKAYYSTEERAVILRKGTLTECFFSIVYQPLVNAEGNINSILQIASEVTEAVFSRRRIQDLNEEMAAANEELRVTNEEMREIQADLLNINSKLADSEEKLRLANDAAGIGNWIVDGTNGKMTTTRRYKEIFGLNPNQETSLEEIASLLSEQYLQKTKQAGEQSVKERKPYVNEYPFRRKHDGALRWARTIGAPKYDEQGKLSVFTGVTMDITESVTHRQKIEESEERFRTMAEGTNVMIAVGDENSNATYFNKSWEKLTGRTEKELINFGWTDVVHPDDKEQYVNTYLSAFEKKIPFTGEMRVRDKLGNYRWLLTQGSPRFRNDGSFAGYISACTDITEQKKDDQRKNDFISMVSHELKTPLTSLTGYIELVSYGLKKHDDTRNMNLLERANRQIGKMTKMINGFLNVTRLESGKIQIDKTRFDMAVLVKEHEEETFSTISSHTFIFEPVVETWVEADRDKIGHVIHNLISNAVKYAPTGSTIQIACVTVQGEAMVSVKDEGIGIDPEDKEKLFDRFYRVKNQTTQAVAGFGIGLYLCAEIVQRHEGKIWVNSEPAKGATFYFTLPLAGDDEVETARK